jgi:hypothetical protein
MQAIETHQSALANLSTAALRIYEHFNPPPDLTVTEWAMLNRYLPKGATVAARPVIKAASQIFKQSEQLG